MGKTTSETVSGSSSVASSCVDLQRTVPRRHCSVSTYIPRLMNRRMHQQHGVPLLPIFCNVPLQRQTDGKARQAPSVAIIDTVTHEPGARTVTKTSTSSA